MRAWDFCMQAIRMTLIFVIGCVSTNPSHSNFVSTTTFVLKDQGPEFSIGLPDLSISARNENGKTFEISQPMREFLKINPLSLKHSNQELLFSDESRGLRTHLKVKYSRLTITFESEREQKISWPITTGDSQALGLIYPQSEGLFLPIQDSFWLSYASEGVCRNLHGGLSMPFWGVLYPHGSITYLVLTDIRSELCVKSMSGKISAIGAHEFKQMDQLKNYQMIIALDEATPVAPAKIYRNWLLETDQFRDFSDKLKENPEVEKLFGAIHGYLYGKARSKKFIKDLHDLKIKKAALFYDQDPRSQRDQVTPETIRFARRLGYIIGPYDTFNHVDHPIHANSYPGIFDENLYLEGGILNADKTREKGFDGFGFELSSEALKRAKKPFFQLRMQKHQKEGANGLFIDCDAFGNLHDDFDPNHPMNPEKDRQNRLERMGYASGVSKFILGSESAAGWSSTVIHFSHGTFTPQTDTYWKYYGQKKMWGRWWPQERPAIFFKKVNPASDLIKANFSPEYRIPLYEIVFHDSVISLDRWESDLVKFPPLIPVRTNLTLLYGVPSLWNFDPKVLKENSTHLKKLYSFFSPIHQKIGTLPMTDFRWLSSDRLIQMSKFGDEFEITANFSDSSYQGIPPQGVQAKNLKEGSIKLYFP